MNFLISTFLIIFSCSFYNIFILEAEAAAASSSTSDNVQSTVNLDSLNSHNYYYDPSLYAMKDPASSYSQYSGVSTTNGASGGAAQTVAPLPYPIPIPISPSMMAAYGNGLHTMNAADLIDITKLNKKRVAGARRRNLKTINYGNGLMEFPIQFQAQHSQLKVQPRTEDIWALDGKAKHLEVLLLFVILAGLLLKVAFSLLWWKQALGGMSAGWGPMQFGGGGGGWGGGGGGGSGWGGWRQLEESNSTILDHITDFVEKALQNNKVKYSTVDSTSASTSQKSKEKEV